MLFAFLKNKENALKKGRFLYFAPLFAPPFCNLVVFNMGCGKTGLILKFAIKY